MNSFIEIMFSVGLFINAILFLPQGINLLKKKDSAEVSLITFQGFWLIQLATLFHGILKQDYPLVIGIALAMLTCGWVVWLIVYYRFWKN